MRAVIVIVEKEVRKVGCTVNARLITTCVSPFTGDGLDEAFGFAVGLWTVRFGEEMLNAEFPTSGGEVLGAVG